MPGPCCYRGPCLGLWSYCGLNPRRSLRFLLHQSLVWVRGSTVTGSTVCGLCSDIKEQGSHSAVTRVTADAQLSTRSTEDSGTTPPPLQPLPNSNSLNKKPSMRTLKNGDRMLKCHSPPKSFQRGWGGEARSSSLRGRPLRVYR